MKRLEAVSFVGESRAVVKLVGIEISRSLDKISVNEGYQQHGGERDIDYGLASQRVPEVFSRFWDS